MSAHPLLAISLTHKDALSLPPIPPPTHPPLYFFSLPPSLPSSLLMIPYCSAASAWPIQPDIGT